MGMAASQARFLNLTARKTNIEFQGQQINQQRTELSNQSASLYNQMLQLQVPVPPNTQDYTKVQYVFTMPGGNDEATISQFTQAYDSSTPPQPIDGKYTVAFSYKTVELGVVPCTDNEKPKASYVTTDKWSITTSSGKSYTTTKYNSSDTQMKKIHGDMVTKMQTGHTPANDPVHFINVGTDEKPKYEYFYESELPSSGSNVVTYYYAGDVETWKQDTYTPCTINRDSQNRVQSFTYTNGGVSTTFAVTTLTVTDDDAYTDAMNEYTYQSYLYEQEMNKLNARTSIIQAQDRELELKLKQLDTEHNAIQTEADAVQSICKKNVEDSFKTFA